LAIVLNGSPLFTGSAGSGESNIRQWIIENDLLDAIIALPTDMFYNTGISTYIWILDNAKTDERKGKIQLINAVEMFAKMRKSLGSKRKMLRPQDIEKICELYDGFENHDNDDDEAPALSKVFDNSEFGYRTITVERPLQLRFHIADDTADLVLAAKTIAKLPTADQDAIRSALDSLSGRSWTNRDAFVNELRGALKTAGMAKVGAPIIKAIWTTIGEHDPEADVITTKGNPEPDTSLRDTENVPLTEDVEEYFAREVLPHVPDAWIDHDKTRIGYEIPFTRHFYRYTPPRPLEEIQKDLRQLVTEIQAMLAEVGA
ncbi:SAM-dependent methyltransferase, partial [Dietzia cinnamea]|uniref:HsdM family class I SAM-dependent methyltransferase n=1 Tax=Dietzia cinnamea TaxID=321318 RepID=UPI00223B021D